MPVPDIVWQDGPNDSKVTAIHAALLRNGKVLIFHCRSYPMWSRLYDPFDNSDQRYIELAFEGVFGQGDTYLVTAPDNPNIAPPGYYMLFVLKDVSESNSGLSKIPSNAVFIKLSIAT